MSATMTTGELAQLNAAAGWSVFPCLAVDEPADADTPPRKAKAPYVDWKLATTDPDRIDKWWRIFPSALVGVALPEGVTVIDLDMHDDRDGIALAAGNGWPVEAEVQGTSTDGNGRHLWYAGESRNAPVATGYVDRKTVGGYVVTPYALPERSQITEPLPAPYVVGAAAPVILATTAETAAWLAKHHEAPDDVMRHELDSVNALDEFRGDDNLARRVRYVVKLAEVGYLGAAQVLAGIRDAWDRSEHTSESPTWFDRTLAYAIAAESIPEHEPDLDLAPEPTPDQDDKPMLRFVSLDELAKRPRPESLIEDYVQAGRMMMLVGEPGIGKSFVALSWSASIACGTPYFGHKARQGTVLYVGAEGADAFSERMAAWERENDQTIPRDRLLFADQSMSLTDAESVALTVQAVKHYGASLVVLDTFSQLSGVADENNAAMVSQALSAAQAIRQAGNGDTAVLLVHHTTKSGQSYRGSTALLGNVDSMMMMTGSSSSFALTNRASDGGKLKDGTPLRESGFSIEGSDGGSAFVSRGGADPIQEAVLEVLADGEWHPRTDFEDRIGTHSESTLKRRLSDMVEHGLIAKEGNAKATVYALPGKVVF